MKWTARLSLSGCEMRDTHRCESRFVRASAFNGRRLSSKEMVDVAQRDSAELLAPGALFHFPEYQPMSSPTAAPVACSLYDLSRHGCAQGCDHDRGRFTGSFDLELAELPSLATSIAAEVVDHLMFDPRQLQRLSTK